MVDADELPEEAAPEGLDGSIPGELCERGRAVWTRLVPDLLAAGRLKRTDREALTRYCDLVAQYWDMTVKIREEGETILTPTIAKGADGKSGEMWRRHPLLSERRAVAQGLKDLEDRFGMSPLSRANLTIKLLGRGGGGGGLFDLPGVDGSEAGDEADPANYN